MPKRISWRKKVKYFPKFRESHICKHFRKLNLSGVMKFCKLKNVIMRLYWSKQVDNDCQESSQFFDNPNIPKLTNELKNVYEGKVLIEEVTEVLKVPANDEFLAGLFHPWKRCLESRSFVKIHVYYCG